MNTMKHLNKMATALDQATETALNTHGTFNTVEMAKAAFDALMDAVPDLVWVDHGGTYISDRPVDTSRYVIRQHPNDSDWAIAPEDSCVFLYFNTLDKAKAWANNHRRAQARDIWEG